MKLIKHKNNKDVAYKVDYMVSHGKVCHFYGGYVNISTGVIRRIDDEKLSIILDDLADWQEKTIPQGLSHKDLEWKKLA